MFHLENEVTSLVFWFVCVFVFLWCLETHYCYFIWQLEKVLKILSIYIYIGSASDNGEKPLCEKLN